MKTNKAILLITAACGALFVVAIASCVGSFFFMFRNLDAAISPTIDELFAAIEEDSFAATYDTHTTAELRQTATREQYEDLGRMIKARLGSLKSKNLAQFNVRQLNANRFADVTYNATFEDGPGTIKAKFKKNGERWLLVNFQVDSPEFQKDLATGKCLHCDEPHTSTARFCPKCGNPLTDGREPASSASSAANASDSR